MLSENIKAFRKTKGLSQEELAARLNVVRQTISKWEQGLSVPDADLLIALSEALETPVSTRTMPRPMAEDTEPKKMPLLGAAGSVSDRHRPAGRAVRRA